jgi:23S rRNA (uracil1939-C5)-methyltransferase
VELVIESLAAGGDGVAHDPDGRVVFVPFTAPGDRVRVRIVRERARHAHARVEALLEPGPGRADPVCPVFGSCGGCAWQHVDPAVQREAKARIVSDALARIGGLAWGGEIEVTPSPSYAYRARSRVLREQGRTGFRHRRSHRLQAVTRCPVLVPELDRALHELAVQAPSGGPHAQDAQEWELAAGHDALRCAPVGKGEPIELLLGGDALRISPGVFFQSNGPLHEALAEAVTAAAGQGGSVLELYAGAGVFTLGLARRFERVTAVEAHPAAAEDLRHNLERAGLHNVEVHGAALETLWDGLPEADVLVLDPPRSGLPGGAAPRLAGLGASRIVYLSCDPATLARDLSDLTRAGAAYRLSHVGAFDLFPQTPHVEALCVLDR